MLALADFANDDGICWPGTASLAKKINESPDYTDTIIKKCIKLGELAKHSGQGRGHPSRFAILCGLDTEAQKKLKGVLQKGYPSTPIEKRGTPIGVLSSDKRGTFSDANDRANGAAASDKTPISENDNQHDPIVGDDGDRARAKKALSDAGMYPATIRQILAMPLDWPTVITSIANLRTAGWGSGAIADRLRDSPPVKGHPYEQPEQRPVQPQSAPDQPRRSERDNRSRPKGSHNGTGGAELRNPGWMDDLIAKAERGEL